jgi:hypothetical protein
LKLYSYGRIKPDLAFREVAAKDFFINPKYIALFAIKGFSENEILSRLILIPLTFTAWLAKANSILNISVAVTISYVMVMQHQTNNLKIPDRVIKP